MPLSHFNNSVLPKFPFGTLRVAGFDKTFPILLINFLESTENEH
jgi:hypothetical protein